MTAAPLLNLGLYAVNKKGETCAMLRRAMQGYAVLEAVLADKTWLIDDAFSAADIMIGTSVRYLHSLQLLNEARCSAIGLMTSLLAGFGV